ncbi:MAG: hypothetical protein ACRDJX_00765, partial [Solirubrobacteraceae bacterium]
AIRTRSPRTPAMARPAVKLRVHPAHLTSQNTAVVQGCVPLVEIDGESYRMRGHRAKIAQLRAGLNAPPEGGDF